MNADRNFLVGLVFVLSLCCDSPAGPHLRLASSQSSSTVGPAVHLEDGNKKFGFIGLEPWSSPSPARSVKTPPPAPEARTNDDPESLGLRCVVLLRLGGGGIRKLEAELSCIAGGWMLKGFANATTLGCVHGGGDN